MISLRRIQRGGSRAAATSKMERFVIIVNDFQPLTIITKRSILDVAATLDPPLNSEYSQTAKIRIGFLTARAGAFVSGDNFSE